MESGLIKAVKKARSKAKKIRDDSLLPEYKINYSKTWPNPYAGKVKYSHGGSRPGIGRRPRFGQPMIRKTIRLTEQEIARLERLGAGNLSEGLVLRRSYLV